MEVLVKLINQNEVINISADDELNKVVVNGKEVDFEAAYFIHRIVVITSSWQEKMIDNNIIDGVSYKVKLIKGKKEKVFEGKNCFPKNYGEFDRLLGEVLG